MPALWLIIAGIALFFLFFSYDRLDGAYAMLLSAGWVGVFLLSVVEVMGMWRTARHKPTRRDRDAAFHAEMNMPRRRRYR
jgi:uncharacterized membrane protein